MKTSRDRTMMKELKKRFSFKVKREKMEKPSKKTDCFSKKTDNNVHVLAINLGDPRFKASLMMGNFENMEKKRIAPTLVSERIAQCEPTLHNLEKIESNTNVCKCGRLSEANGLCNVHNFIKNEGLYKLGRQLRPGNSVVERGINRLVTWIGDARFVAMAKDLPNATHQIGFTTK